MVEKAELSYPIGTDEWPDLNDVWFIEESFAEDGTSQGMSLPVVTVKGATESR
jgi:hypothetical protein